MRGGFLRGLVVGAVVGTVSGILMDSETREKAKGLMNTGGHLLHKAEDGMEMASGWVHKGQKMLQDEVTPAFRGMGGAGEINEMFGEGKEEIDSRVAILEQRLEQLEGRGAQ